MSSISVRISLFYFFSYHAPAGVCWARSAARTCWRCRCWTHSAVHSVIRPEQSCCCACAHVLGTQLWYRGCNREHRSAEAQTQDEVHRCLVLLFLTLSVVGKARGFYCFVSSHYVIYQIRGHMCTIHGPTLSCIPVHFAARIKNAPRKRISRAPQRRRCVDQKASYCSTKICCSILLLSDTGWRRRRHQSTRGNIFLIWKQIRRHLAVSFSAQFIQGVVWSLASILKK